MAVISLYLYICFGALLLYKSAILEDVGINFTHWGLAAIKALIMANEYLESELAELQAAISCGCAPEGLSNSDAA